MSPGQQTNMAWCNIHILLFMSLLVSPVLSRGRRQLIKSSSVEDIQRLSLTSPVLTVQHEGGGGRGLLVRRIEHIQRDLHQLGILVKKMENSVIHSSHIDISYKGEKFVYEGKPEYQDVMRWALKATYCYKDSVDKLTESQLNVVKRHLPSFAIIYHYPTPQAINLLETLLSVTEICHKSGASLLYLAEGDLAPLDLYLPLDRRPALVLYAHNIPLVYTGQLEPESLLGWLRETHDTDTNMVKLSSRNLQRIIALERTVLVLFHLRSDSSPLIVRASSSRLDRLGVVVVTLGHIKEVAGLGVTSLPSLVMFKHGLPIIYHGDLEVTGLDQVFNWVSKESGKDERVLITGVEGPVKVSDFQSDQSHPSTLLVKPHRHATQKLAIEYGRLARENQKLRATINSAMAVLDSSLAKQTTAGSTLRHECGDCVGAVGQAIWDCGTLDMDCIKNCIDASSQCFGCICEVLDFWWPTDAPNCFRKEMIRAMQEGPETGSNGGEQKEREGNEKEPENITSERESFESDLKNVPPDITMNNTEENNIVEILIMAVIILIVSVVILYNRS